MRRGGALLREKGEGAGGDGGTLDNVLDELKKRHRLFEEMTRETKGEFKIDLYVISIKTFFQGSLKL